jgi:dTDP-4-amino-4,6-dideoxygalactose transaminase
MNELVALAAEHGLKLIEDCAQVHGAEYQGVKLKYLDGWIDRRNAVAAIYMDALKNHLEAAGIQTGIHYPISLPNLEAYRYLDQAREPFLASRLASQVLSLPIGEHLSDADVEMIVSEIRAFKNKS